MKIGNFDFNKDATFIIAEMSANHNGSLKIAKQTIQKAKECGADAIKLQTYRADTITLNSKNKDFKITQGTLWDDKYLYELYEKAYTPWQWHKELFEYAREVGIDIFSSPFDKSAVDFLEQFNPPAYKIASFEITDYELVRYTASKMKPIIISTGIAYKDEIKDVVEIFIDDWEIKVGDSIVRKIDEAAQNADFFVLVLSKHSIKQEWVKREIDIAFTKLIQKKSKILKQGLL